MQRTEVAQRFSNRFALQTKWNSVIHQCLKWRQSIQFHAESKNTPIFSSKQYHTRLKEIIHSNLTNIRFELNFNSTSVQLLQNLTFYSLNMFYCPKFVFSSAWWKYILRLVFRNCVTSAMENMRSTIFGIKYISSAFLLLLLLLFHFIFNYNLTKIHILNFQFYYLLNRFLLFNDLHCAG